MIVCPTVSVSAQDSLTLCLRVLEPGNSIINLRPSQIRLQPQDNLAEPGIAPDLLGCFSVFSSAHCWPLPDSAKSSSKQVLLSGIRRLDPLGESHRGLTSPRDDLRGFRVAVELYETHLQQFLKALRRVSRQLLPRNGEVLFHVIYDIFER